MKKTHFYAFSILSLSLVCGLTASADTQIGDTTFFVGESVSNGNPSKYSISYTIESFNASTGTYHIPAVINWGGSVFYLSRDTAKTDMMTEEKSAAIVKNCETTEGGILETVKVMAGTFLACKKPNPQNAAQINWYAPVPVGGTVKFIYSENNGTRVTTAELNSYKKGN